MNGRPTQVLTLSPSFNNQYIPQMVIPLSPHLPPMEPDVQQMLAHALYQSFQTRQQQTDETVTNNAEFIVNNRR